MSLGCTISEELDKILHSSRGEGVGIVKVGETFNEDGEKWWIAREIHLLESIFWILTRRILWHKEWWQADGSDFTINHRKIFFLVLIFWWTNKGWLSVLYIVIDRVQFENSTTLTETSLSKILRIEQQLDNDIK